MIAREDDSPILDPIDSLEAKHDCAGVEGKFEPAIRNTSELARTRPVHVENFGFG